MTINYSPGCGAPQIKCRGSWGAFGGTNSTSLSTGSLDFIIGRGPSLNWKVKKKGKQLFTDCHTWVYFKFGRASRMNHRWIEAESQVRFLSGALGFFPNNSESSSFDFCIKFQGRELTRNRNKRDYCRCYNSLKRLMTTFYYYFFFWQRH